MEFDYEQLKQEAAREYYRWVEKTADDEYIQEELKEMDGNEEEITDAFYKPIRFGTSGLRGILGAGTNRMNVYTVRRAAQGLANYLNEAGFYTPSVIVSYDSRKSSRYFAENTAAVLNGNGIRTYLFHELTPVSVLSYAIRSLQISMGVMITASHNPKIYNGFKVYNSEGYQVIDEEASEILENILNLDYFSDIKMKTDGILKVPPRIKTGFIKEITENWMPQDVDMMNRLKVIYTPLNGTGAKYLPKVFNGIGYQKYAIVPSQKYPDPEFTTCPTPNPEKVLAYDEGFKMLDQQGGDLIIATDPDADRAGAALYHDGMRSLLTGNQLGLLMLDYLCHIRPPEPEQFVVKSIVTTPLVCALAEKYGFRVVDTPTGFRYIGKLVSQIRQIGREDKFYFGFEESDSFLVSPFLNEKDGISASVLIAETAAFHKSQGKDLIDRLQELYSELGVCVDKQRTFTFSGAQGQDCMQRIMEYFRQNVTDHFGGKRIDRKTDYLDYEGYPSTNVLVYDFEDGCRLIIRPSGTEAKLKVYSFETGDFSRVEREVVQIIEKFKVV